MNPDTSYVNAYLLSDRIIGALLGSGPEGLVLSFDIGGSLFDTVARNAARASSHQFVDMPSLVRYRSQLYSRSQQLSSSDVIEEPTLFGRVDGFVRTQDETEIFESYGPSLERAMTRSIDSWASGRPLLRHIHFGDPGLTLDQIAGAEKSFATDRPTATFYISGLERRALLLQLERYGYRTLDLDANEVQPEESDALGDFGWIAIPSERYAEVSPGLPDLVRGDAAQFSEWQEVMERNTNARQHGSPSVFGLRANALPLDHKFAAPDIIVEDDCYPVEFEGGSSWRWLGPRARTRLFLPCAVPGIYRIEIAVLGNHLNDGLGQCRVLVEGREIETRIRGKNDGAIQFVGQLEARSYVGYMTVDIVSPGGVVSISAEPRTLRLSIQSIMVSPWR